MFCVAQAAWSLKTRALTEMVYIDEVEVDEEGIAEMMLDESSIAQVARKFHIFSNALRLKSSIHVEDVGFLQVLEHH